MSLHYEDAGLRLWHGSNKEILPTFADASFDSIVTDPPYELGFMGKGWDSSGIAYDVDVWRECLRVLKPGGHLLAFGGTRTWHRIAVAIEDAGFEIRDSIAWLYGSGFPKSLDVSKQIDQGVGGNRERQLTFTAWMRSTGITATTIAEATGTNMASHYLTDKTQPAIATADQFDLLRPHLPEVPEHIERLVAERTGIAWADYLARPVTGRHSARILVGNSGPTTGGEGQERRDIPATDAARQWQGWGTALKPSHEPVVVARKPAGPTAILDTIGSQLGALEEACRRRVSGAARSSARTRADSSVARTATAPASAATRRGAGQEPTTATGAAASSSAATATSASAWTAERFLSTVTSWRECWVEIYEATSTSTTSTATSRTTDLQTLSSCLSSITQSVTAQSTLDPRSWSSLATAADNLFAAGVLSSRSTLALSVIESATSATPEDSPPAAGSPAFEPIIVARKPLAGTVAANVLKHGTGALNIDATRVPMSDRDREVIESMGGFGRDGYARPRTDETFMQGTPTATAAKAHDAGRWPTNVVLDESQAAALDAQSGYSKGRGGAVGLGKGRADNPSGIASTGRVASKYDDEGGASRFFPTFRYEAKAPTSERPNVEGTVHATVKPLELMRWLIRLVTRPGGRVLDPFAGSGTTGEAALLEGMECDLIELEADHLPLILQRVRKPLAVGLFTETLA